MVLIEVFCFCFNLILASKVKYKSIFVVALYSVIYLSNFVWNQYENLASY